MVNKWKTIALVAMGFSAGTMFVVACGTDDNGGGRGIPGIPVALAQSGCSQWETVIVDKNYLPDGTRLDAVTGSDDITRAPQALELPKGWTPIERSGSSIHIVRCVD